MAVEAALHHYPKGDRGVFRLRLLIYSLNANVISLTLAR